MGFLFWDWGFYFIALFFLFDLIFKTFFLKKRLSALEEMRGRNKFLLYSFLFSLIEVLMIHFIVNGAFPSLNIGDTFIDFLSYEELGIAQGIVLLPLLFLNEWMRIRNENKIAVPHTIRIQIMFNSQRVQVYRLILWLAMGLGVLFLSINELTLIIAFFLFFIAQPFLVFRNVN